MDEMRRPFRLGPRATKAFDIVIGLAAVLPSFSALAFVHPAATVFNVLETLPLFWRRNHPVLAFVVVAGASGSQALFYDYPVWGQVAFPVALYSLAKYSTAAAGWAGLGTGVAGAMVSSWVWTRAVNEDTPVEYRDTLTPGNYLPFFLLVSAIVLAAWALGAQSRTRGAYEATLLERGERLAFEAEQRAVMAAADERARIAREMHDVVAHGLSVVIVQADGARYAAEQDPAVAVRTLGAIADTGRDALAEMRRLLGLLRGTTAAELVPQPGLGDLPALLAQETDRISGDLPDPLPTVSDGVALTVFRVVQESLTNVRKHAGPSARVTVRLESEPDAVVVEVVDDGRGAAAGRGDGSPGLGLVGMRERVEVHGGTLETGPVPGGGWRVRARIPT